LQWFYKSPAMAAMVVMVCQLALKRGMVGEFSANDLPIHTAKQHGGRGIAGSVMKDLASPEWGVLAPVGSFAGPEFVQKYVKNAGGNPIRVWRLKSAALASRLIELHGGECQKRFKQAELLPAA
jgi:hypothetical protein